MTIRTEALPELLSLWNGVESTAAAEGIAIGIADFGGFRTEGDTALILQYRVDDYNADLSAGRISPTLSLQDYRPIAPYGQSWHDYGAARDFKIVSKPASLSTDDAIARVDTIAESIGLRTGASYGDPWHLELAVPLDQAAAMWADYQAAGGASSSSSSSSSGPGSAAMSAIWIGLAIGAGALTVLRYWRGMKL